MTEIKHIEGLREKIVEDVHGRLDCYFCHVNIQDGWEEYYADRDGNRVSGTILFTHSSSKLTLIPKSEDE